PSNATVTVCTFNMAGKVQSFAVNVTTAHEKDFFHVRSSPRMWSFKAIEQAEYEKFMNCHQ
ncbi:hypothetical protein GCK32_009266, partial [Trichostrongylus colubriformis]